MKRLLKNLIRRTGFDLIRYYPGNSNPMRSELADLTPPELKIVDSIEQYTMTTAQRIAALIDAIHYITSHRIPGDLVECGVWRGGSMMAAALTLDLDKDTSRDLYLYDTFEGMPAATDKDRDYMGQSGGRLRGEFITSFEEVHTNILSTGYPKDRIHLVKGMVEETIPRIAPRQICLLRLDTDWYESTKHELRYLFPLLQPGGVLIIDDYGHWQGARKATDEYFRENELDLYFHRVDYSCRLAILPSIKRIAFQQEHRPSQKMGKDLKKPLGRQK
jgi:O-methyltransferase